MDQGKTDQGNTPQDHANQVRTWCQLFEERVNDWLDERLPLKAELFFDETPPDGASEKITLSASLVDENAPHHAGADAIQTVEVPYTQFIRALRAHVENCADCGDLALGYGDLQQVIWSLQPPQPTSSFVASAVSKISVEMQEHAVAEPVDDQATRDTVEMRTAETVSMKSADIDAVSAESEHRSEVPRFNTSAITGNVAAAVSAPESIDRDSATFGVAESRGRLILRRGVQLAAVAATVVIAVAIAFNTPDPISPGNGHLASSDGNSADVENNANQPRSFRMPTFSMLESFGAFGSVLPNPNGGLIDEARNRSEEALEEMSGGLAPLADSTRQSASFLESLIPLDALGESAGTEQ